MKVAYPVIFTDVGTNILIEVPDLGILTESNEEGKTKGSMVDAITMARDAIVLSNSEAKEAGKKVIQPSKMTVIDISKGKFFQDGVSILSLVDAEIVS